MSLRLGAASTAQATSVGEHLGHVRSQRVEVLPVHQHGLRLVGARLGVLDLHQVVDGLEIGHLLGENVELKGESSPG